LIFFQEQNLRLLSHRITNSELELVIRAITESARTGDKGEHGDGIIFISSVDQVINIASDYRDKISS